MNDKLKLNDEELEQVSGGAPMPKISVSLPTKPLSKDCKLYQCVACLGAFETDNYYDAVNHASLMHGGDTSVIFGY